MFASSRARRAFLCICARSPISHSENQNKKKYHRPPRECHSLDSKYINPCAWLAVWCLFTVLACQSPHHIPDRSHALAINSRGPTSVPDTPDQKLEQKITHATGPARPGSGSGLGPITGRQT